MSSNESLCEQVGAHGWWIDVMCCYGIKNTITQLLISKSSVWCFEMGAVHFHCLLIKQCHTSKNAFECCSSDQLCDCDCDIAWITNGSIIKQLISSNLHFRHSYWTVWSCSHWTHSSIPLYCFFIVFQLNMHWTDCCDRCIFCNFLHTKVIWKCKKA